MAIKAKIKTSQKTLSSPVKTRCFNLSKILKHKKIIGGVGLIVVVATLVVVFKNIFIVAVVNGELITRFSVISVLEKQSGKTVLENLITKKLILQEAKKKKISITQSDIDSEIKKISENLQSQGSTLDQALASQGMTKADLNDELKVQVAFNKMTEKDVSVTEKEINDFVTANASQMTAETTEEEFRKQATEQLKQQKLQTKSQEFIKSLQDKAKIAHFVSY